MSIKYFVNIPLPIFVIKISFLMSILAHAHFYCLHYLSVCVSHWLHLTFWLIFIRKKSRWKSLNGINNEQLSWTTWARSLIEFSTVIIWQWCTLLAHYIIIASTTTHRTWQSCCFFWFGFRNLCVFYCWCVVFEFCRWEKMFAVLFLSTFHNSLLVIFTSTPITIACKVILQLFHRVDFLLSKCSKWRYF